MEERLKQRLVGAIVLVSLAVVFVPILLDVPDVRDEEYSATPIPERPQHGIDSTVRIELGVPETPRLDAEVEREREASDTAAGIRVEPSETGAPASAAASEAPEATVTATAPQPEVVEPTAAAVPADSSPARREPPVPKPDGGAAKKQAKTPPAEPAVVARKQWAVQLGSFQKSGNANALRKRLRDEGYDAIVESSSSAQGEVFRVLVGPSTDRVHAKNSAVKLLLEMNIEGFVVPYPGG